MKAIVAREYGSPDVLVYKDVEKPNPKDDEVLVRVHAASANAADWHLMRGKPFLVRLMGFGFRRPKNNILGADIAGRVEAAGCKVRRFQTGEAVFGDISVSALGGFAEYACASEDALVRKPKSISFEQAAAVPVAALTALQGLRDKGKIRAGQQVLINGASGGVGTFAVQIARSFGAEVTAVCSTRNLELMRSLGANHVVDYTQEDFTRTGAGYDLILDTAARHSLFDCRRALNPKGTYVFVGGSTFRFFQVVFLGPLLTMVGTRRMVSLLMQPNNKDLIFLKQLLESGSVMPVIDRRYPLCNVPEAIRYLEEGHTRGKVVITFQQGQD